MSKQQARGQLRVEALIWAGLLCLVTSLGCEATGKNEVARRLLRPVSVVVEGQVVDATSGAALPSIGVALQRRPLDGSSAGSAPTDATAMANGRADAGAGSGDRELVPGVAVVTDKDGHFSLTTELDIEAYDYNLRVADAAGRYVLNDSFRVYAGSDTTIEVGVLKLTLSSGEQRVTVRGTVLAAPGGTGDVKALKGAEVALIDPSDESRYAATTDKDGKYELSEVPFRDYTLEIKAPLDAAKARVKLLPVYQRTLQLASEKQAKDEASDVTVVTLQTTHMPATAVVAKDGTVSPAGLTIMLSWDAEGEACKSGGELHAELSLPGPNCDNNHLGGSEVRLPPAASLNPSGFGVATCMWPSHFGGRVTPVLGEDEITDTAAGIERVALNAKRRMHTIQDPFDEAKLFPDDPFISNLPNRPDDSCTDISNILAPDLKVPKGDVCTTAFYGRVAETGKGPEILRVTRNRGTRDWPKDLGYYYELSVDARGETARRYPMGFGALRVFASGECTLDAMRAVVEVYDEDELVGRFERNPSEKTADAVTAWTPFVLELGARRAITATARDMYFRILPLDSAAPSARAQSYFFQDVATQRATCDRGCGGEPQPLSSAQSAIAQGDSDVVILGESRSVAAQNEEVIRSLSLYRQTSLGTWVVFGLAGGAGTRGTIALDGDVLLASVGRQISIEDELGGFFDCSPCKEDVVGMLSAPGRALIVATKKGLNWFDPSKIQGTDCWDPPTGPAPTACAALKNGVPKPLNEEYTAEISWVGRSARSGKVLLGSDGIVWEVGAISPDQGAQQWRAYAVTSGGPTLSVLELGQDAWLGTDEGLWLARTYPAPASGAPRAYHINDCPPDATTLSDPRPSVSLQAVQAIARYGEHLVVGTPIGLGISSVETVPEGDDKYELTCLKWLPTQGQAASATALPPFPANLDVKGLLVVDGELLVLTAERGLFRLRGGL